MAYRGLKVLAVVPARGGSKGIPRKNLCEVGGVSLVGRCGDLCASLPWIDRAVLSTDDDEIAAEGAAHGLDVPFRRPEALSGDGATSVNMWQHAWQESETQGETYDIGILLEPTSPLRCAADVTRTVDSMLDARAGAAATVSRAPASFTPHKCLTVNAADSRIGFYLPEGARYSLRQSIPAYYFRNGICYAVRRKTLIEHGHILEEDCVAVEVERPVANIDTPFDLELAEFLFSREQRAQRATN